MEKYKPSKAFKKILGDDVKHDGKIISVTPRCKKDEKKAKVLEEMYNNVFNELTNLPVFKRKFALHCLSGTLFTKEETEEFIKQVI